MPYVTNHKEWIFGKLGPEDKKGRLRYLEEIKTWLDVSRAGVRLLFQVLTSIVEKGACHDEYVRGKSMGDLHIYVSSENWSGCDLLQLG
jgi:hypothetical protein